jgi:acyl-CoA thioesterase-2
MAATLNMLVEILDLKRIGENILRGRSPDERLQRVFRSPVPGQAPVAAGGTVPSDRPVHSLHAYFIRPGDPDAPIVDTVDRIRDGRSFTTRREYQTPMPEAPDPRTVPDLAGSPLVS